MTRQELELRFRLAQLSNVQEFVDRVGMYPDNFNHADLVRAVVVAYRATLAKPQTAASRVTQADAMLPYVIDEIGN